MFNSVDFLKAVFRERKDSVGSYDAFRDLHEPSSVDLLRVSIIRSLNKKAFESQGFLERRYDGNNSNNFENRSSAKYSVVKVENLEQNPSSSFETDSINTIQMNLEDQEESMDYKANKSPDKRTFIESLSFNSLESSGEHSELERTYDDWEMTHFKYPKSNQRNRTSSNANNFKLASRKFSDSIFEDCSTYDITCFNEDFRNEKDRSTKSISNSYNPVPGVEHLKSELDDSLSIRTKDALERDLFSIMKEDFCSKSVNSLTSENDSASAKIERKHRISNKNEFSIPYGSPSPSDLFIYEKKENWFSDKDLASKDKYRMTATNICTSKESNSSISSESSVLEMESLRHTNGFLQKEDETNSPSTEFTDSASRKTLETQEQNNQEKERKDNVFNFKVSKLNEKFTDEHTSLYDTFFTRVTNGENQSPPTPTQQLDLNWPVSSEKTTIADSNNSEQENNPEDSVSQAKRRHSKRHRKRSRKKSRSRKSYVYECSNCGVSYIIPNKAMNDLACCLHCDLWTPVEPVFIKREKQSWNTCRIS